MRLHRIIAMVVLVMLVWVGADRVWANQARLEVGSVTVEPDCVSALLTVHAGLTNCADYGLYLSTNLWSPQPWRWLQRLSFVGQTNILVTNCPLDRVFFSLGCPTAIRPGFNQAELPATDDDSTPPVSVGFDINFFGAITSNLYINNNGNVTFDKAEWQYTPGSLAALGVNIIAPFWADVDTYPLGSQPVTYGTNFVNGRPAFAVNWIDVGYFYYNADKLNTFQLVFVDRADRDPGDYDVEFNYAKVQWETGDASSGTGGLGGCPVRVGFASTNGVTFEMNGSGVGGSFLDSNTTTGLIYNRYNSSVPGRYVFPFHDGTPLGTP